MNRNMVQNHDSKYHNDVQKIQLLHKDAHKVDRIRRSTTHVQKIVSI